MSIVNLSGESIDTERFTRPMSRSQRSAPTPRAGSLLSISDNDLLRHPSLAYNDGYADAREYGQDGMFLATSYTTSAREAYLQGFKRGLRVYRVANR